MSKEGSAQCSGFICSLGCMGLVEFARPALGRTEGLKAMTVLPKEGIDNSRATMAATNVMSIRAACPRHE